MNIIECCEDPKIFKNYFDDLETWRNWMIIFKSLFGIGLSGNEMMTFQECTALAKQPAQKIKELWIRSGRKSGKSRSIAVLVCYLALFKDWSAEIAKGERPHMFIISPNREQSQIIMSYLRGLLHLTPTLRSMIKKEMKESIELKNGITIAIQTATWRGSRGFSASVVIFEEICFFRFEEMSAIRDVEIYRAVKPMLATFKNSLMIGISSPDAPQGLMFQKFAKHHGKKGRVLCWTSKTELLNPTFDKEEIAQAYIDDPESARAEYGAQWRRDLSSLIEPEIIRKSVDKDIFERPHVWNRKAFGFIDPSGGKSDSFTMAISHYDKEKDLVILDVIREIIPPFRPMTIVEEFSRIFKEYQIKSVKSDIYGGEWIASAFRDFGINVEKASMTKSDYYLNAIPIFNNRKCRILDKERLTNQLLNLQRRVRSGARDLVDCFRGHDDLSNACCASLVEAIQRDKKKVFLGFTEKNFPFFPDDRSIQEMPSPETRKKLDDEERKKPIISTNIIQPK